MNIIPAHDDVANLIGTGQGIDYLPPSIPGYTMCINTSGALIRHDSACFVDCAKWRLFAQVYAKGTTVYTIRPTRGMEEHFNPIKITKHPSSAVRGSSPAAFAALYNLGYRTIRCYGFDSSYESGVWNKAQRFTHSLKLCEMGFYAKHPAESSLGRLNKGNDATINALGLRVIYMAPELEDQDLDPGSRDDETRSKDPRSKDLDPGSPDLEPGSNNNNKENNR